MLTHPNRPSLLSFFYLPSIEPSRRRSPVLPPVLSSPFVLSSIGSSLYKSLGPFLAAPSFIRLPSYFRPEGVPAEAKTLFAYSFHPALYPPFLGPSFPPPLGFVNYPFPAIDRGIPRRRWLLLSSPSACLSNAARRSQTAPSRVHFLHPL